MAPPVLDVSKYQGRLDWGGRIAPAYRRTEIAGVVIRSSYGSSTGARVDPEMIRNQSGARSTSVPGGYYHFAYPGRSSGVLQASAMLQIVGRLQVGEFLVLDMEDEEENGRELIPSDVGWSCDFFRTLAQNTAVPLLLYVNLDVLKRFNWTPVRDLGVLLWVASFGANNGRPGSPPSPAPWPRYAMWQYSSKATLAGLSAVDASLLGDSFPTLAHFRKVPPVPDSNPYNEHVATMQGMIRDSGAEVEIDGKAGPKTVAALKAVLEYQQGTMQNQAAQIEALQTQVTEANSRSALANQLRDSLRGLLA